MDVADKNQLLGLLLISTEVTSGWINSKSSLQKQALLLEAPLHEYDGTPSR